MYLELIAKALTDFNEKGIAVIKGSEEVDCGEVAAYVLDVLNGLKCSFDHYLNDVENSYFIIDNMNEVKQMRVVAENVLNTGGGCMVWELTIVDGGDLKSIAINEEGIVGYKTPFDENQGQDDIQFIAMTAEELKMILPENIAVACIYTYHKYLNKFNIYNHLGI